MDGRYHAAKLTACAFGESERIWDEHETFRASLVDRPAPAPELDRAEHLKLALSIQERLVKAGILPAEEMH